MKVLLSSIGSRGDVQPVLALALELRALGHNAEMTARVQTLAGSIEVHGARIAAKRLVNEFG